MADQHRTAALTIAAEAVRAEYRDRKHCGPDACRQCADMDQPIADALGRVARELEVMAAAASPDARERLARHLYLADSGDDQWTRHYWDSGQTSAGTRQRYQQRADAALNVITGTEN